MISKLIHLFIDKSFLKFAIVGLINTVVGATVMFVFYNVFHFSYWTSSASNYFFGSIVSYFLNKHFTFRYNEKGWTSLFKFTLNILVCYLIAYSLAKPLMKWVLSGYSITIQENVSLAVGMCLFTILNYLGQRFFAFKKMKTKLSLFYLFFCVLPLSSQTNITYNEVRNTAVNVNEIKLPILRIQGDFGYEYQLGSVSLEMPDGMLKNNMSAKIKWRGGTTNAEGKHKRNYKIKFDEDQQFFGLRKDNNWILDAGQADLFRLRNRIATELWNDIATKPYYQDSEPEVLSGVRGKMVQLFVNDEYRGIYCLTEVMDRKQLKIKKFDKNTGQIKGGLWKSESYSNALMWEAPPYDNRSDTWGAFEAKYPELDDLEETDYSTLYNAISFVVNSSDEEFAAHVSEYFDMPVVVDYYIFLNVLNAFDNVGKNMYWAVYDKTKDKKLTLAVWDLDATVGAKWLGEWAVPEFTINVNMNLYERLKTINPDNFIQQVNERYQELRNNYLSTDNLISRYDNYYHILKESGTARREELKWSMDSDVNGEVIDFDTEIAYIRDWITRHMQHLDNNVFPVCTYIYELNSNNRATNSIYNLKGQRIINPQKGIYIRNGKKYVVK